MKRIKKASRRRRRSSEDDEVFLDESKYSTSCRSYSSFLPVSCYTNTPTTRTAGNNNSRSEAVTAGQGNINGHFHQRAHSFARTISTSWYVIVWQSLPSCISSPAQPSISFSRIFQKSSRSLPFLSQPVASVRPFLLRIILNVLEAGAPT